MPRRGEKLDDEGAIPFLEPISGPNRGQRFELSGIRISVGRSDQNGIVLPSDAISRVHAFFVQDGDKWRVEDNRSTNGVAVNGARVTDQTLVSGDIIQLGDCILRFTDPKNSSRQAPQKARRRQFAPQVMSNHDTASIDVRALNAVKREGYRVAIYAGVTCFILGLVWMRNSNQREAGGEVKRGGPRADDPKTGGTNFFGSRHPRAPRGTGSKTTAGAQDGGSSEVKVPPPPPPVAKVAQEPESDEAELDAYLSEGKAYLKKGDFKSAAAAFHFAMVIDPENEEAAKGIQAAEYKIKDMTKLPRKDVSDVILGKPVATKKVAIKAPAPRAAPKGEDKKHQVQKLLDRAKNALFQKHYSEAVTLAEEARAISIPGKTDYLNVAKQIIDRAKTGRHDEFEPFLNEANAKYDAGDYVTSHDLCMEMLNRDPGYKEARDCVERARAKLGTASGGGGQ